MNSSLWLPMISLAILALMLRWYFGREARLKQRASTMRWVVVCLGCALAIHATIDTHADQVVKALMAAAGTVLAASLLLFPGLAVRFFDLFEAE